MIPDPDYDIIAGQLEAELRAIFPTAVVQRRAAERELGRNDQDVDRWYVVIRRGATSYSRNVSRADLERGGSIAALLEDIRSRAPESLVGA